MENDFQGLFSSQTAVDLYLRCLTQYTSFDYCRLHVLPSAHEDLVTENEFNETLHKYALVKSIVRSQVSCAQIIRAHAKQGIYLIVEFRGFISMTHIDDLA